MRKVQLLLTFLVFLSCLVLSASDGAKDVFSIPAQQLLLNANKVATAKEAEISMILVERNFEIDADSKVTVRIHRIYRIETEAAIEDWSYASVTYSPWHQLKPEIRARVISPDGIEHVLDQAVLTEGPTKDDEQGAVYDDNRVLQAPLPSISKGSIVEIEIVLKDRESLFLAGIHRRVDFGSQWGPVERAIVTVKVPKSLPLNHVSRLLPNLSVQKRDEGEYALYQFEQGQMEMLEKLEQNLPSEVPQSPYVAFSTGRSWATVSSSYLSTVEARIRVADVQDLVKKEIKPGAERDEAIRKLVALLHKKVRYTGVEFGDAALVPAFPAETLKRGYGDCKDKATLLISMLRAAGIPAHLALLQMGPGQDVEPELPGMAFDHAIVVVPGSPELWIDATASHYRFGLPAEDAGRLALVIRDRTEKLVRIPEARPEDNILLEKREVFLAENGPARIVETWHPQGITEAYLRGTYANTEAKETRESFDSYVKAAYLSEKLGKIQHSDSSNLAIPFWLSIEVERGNRGFTDLNDAIVMIDHTAILDRLPDFLAAKDNEMSEKEREEADKKPRAADFVFTAFVTEWQYRIVPPIGFRVRALPENKSETLGPAKFSVAYSSDNTGTVLVTIRLNSVKGRYTAQEAESMRTAVRQFRKRDYIAIGFDNIGHALIAQGKVAEGLKEYESIAAQHPKEALHRSQYASAMLDVGLCEAARAQAKKATELDPKSAKAFKELGWILQHDLVCRRLKKGFDFDGAVAAYHKALDLDPEDIYTRADLAILYEHGRDGYQYSPSSQLDDAVAEWKAVRKLDSRVGAKYIDNLLFDLIYAKHWKELQTELAAVSIDHTHRSMALVSTVATDGVAAAIEQSKQITPDEVSRSAALIASGNYLIRLRRYADAAEMLSAGAKGQADSAAALQRADLFRRTKRHEEILLPDADPRSLVQKMMVTTFKNSEDPSLCAMSARLSMQGMTCADAMERSRTKRESGQARGQIAKSGLPADVLSDIVLSNLQMTVDGDDKVGYKIMLQPLGAKSSPMYVVKEDEKYVILATESDADDVCAEALVRLDANNEAGARRLLDWLRADTQISGGDDPLAGRLFARMWTRGQEANPDTMRAAALSMVDTREDAGRWIPALIAARDKAKSETNRGYLEAALASAYSKERNWPELRASALRLLTIFPDSNVARSMLGLACYHLKDWETIRKAIEARLSAVPDDPEVERQLADFYSAQGKFEESGVILKKLIDSGRANANDMNSYSWNQLIMGRVTDDGIEQARRAVSLQKSYGIVHTLAAIYAEHGNPQEARQLLLNIMDDYGMDEPDDSLWYVFGRIAEAYEQPQAARSYYQLVRWKEKFEPDPRSTYVLVQKRLKGLLAETAVGAK